MTSVTSTPTVFLLEGLRQVDPDQPVLRADDLGVLRGESVFETLRVLDGKPRFLADHLARFARSAARVDLVLPSGWEDLAAAASAGVQDGSLRLVCSKGGVGFALVSDIPAETVRGRTHGVRVMLLPLGISTEVRAQQPWMLGGVKSTSYAVNMAALRHAQAHGADDAIWFSTDGFVLEAPTATVLALVDDTWVTPPVSAGILPGTTLLAVQAVADVVVRPLPLDELRRAEEIALLSSVRGVAPVVSLDDRELGKGPAVEALAKAYDALLSEA